MCLLLLNLTRKPATDPCAERLKQQEQAKTDDKTDRRQVAHELN
jgi:hypothetical protein